MKKLLLMLAMMSVLCGHTFGQGWDSSMPGPAKRLNWGLRTGVMIGDGIHKCKWGDLSDVTKIGCLGGVPIAYNISKAISIETGVYYLVKVLDGCYSSTISNDNVCKASYVEVPITASFKLPLSLDIGLYFRTGWYEAYKVDCNESLVFEGAMDYGWTAAAGVYFGVFCLETQYDYGLCYIDHDRSLRNRCLFVSLGLMF